MADKNSKMPGFMKAMFAKKAGKGGKKGKPFADGGQMDRDHQKTGKKIAQVNEKMRKKDTAAAGYAKGGSIDGIAKKGKTRTKYPSMKNGGMC